MKTSHFLALLAWLALLPVVLAGPLRPVAQTGPAPLLYVLFSGPPGTRVTFYEGAKQPRDHATPVTVGLRPGYVYRVKLSGFPGRPGFTLFPTLEVRGTLQVSPDVSASRFPAGVYLSEFDAARLAEGAMLTKVVYLEDPRKAFAEPGRADRPIEVELSPDRNLLNEARTHGRPVLIVRAGDRDASEQELAQQSVPGTILFPGEKSLAQPAVPPQLPWACFPWYDPIHGPRHLDEECLHDGGDMGPRAAFDDTGELQGLDPEDTVAEYRDSAGRKRISVSNRVCLCVPRFAALVTFLQLDLARQVLPLGGVHRFAGQVTLASQFGILRRDQFVQPVTFIGSQRPSEAEGLVTTAIVGRLEGLEIVSAQIQMGELASVCEEAPRPPDRPLLLCKWGDRMSAQVGDVVTFTIRYTNQGGRPINDVVVSDSLTGRLAYVPGSNRTSRNAIFTTQENEAGSLVLRWSVTGRLLPGESGTVSFQARVR